MRTILRQLRRDSAPQPGIVSDAQLLARFVKHNDEAAFELLVYRHGPMVLSVCERLLPGASDAEDAFQATFFTLARKAASIGRGKALAAWLYRVAYRICLRARALASARSARERQLADLGAAEPAYVPPDEVAWRDLRPVLDDEVNRLPEKYRAAFVLCCLEGKTNDEAAAQLGCPKGTVLSRLARARERLREALGRRGLAFGAEPLADLLRAHGATLARLSPVLVLGVVQTAAALAVKKAIEGLLAPRVAELTEGAVRECSRRSLGVVAAVALFIGLAGTAGSVYAYNAAFSPTAPQARPQGGGCGGAPCPAQPCGNPVEQGPEAERPK